MNTKAQRQEMMMPPLLNMQEDKPHIAQDFRSVEHLNAPYLNGMLTPMWRLESDKKTVYDKNNNAYEIENGMLVRNGTELFRVGNKGFKKDDFEADDCLDFDFDDEDNMAYLKWNSNINGLELTYNGKSVSSGGLFVNGILIAYRVRVLGEDAVACVLYEYDNTLRWIYLNTNGRTFKENVTWHVQYPKTNATSQHFYDAAITKTVTVSNINPLIQISNPKGIVAISVMSNRGMVHTLENGYFTFLDDGNVMSSSVFPADGTASETVTEYNITNFSMSYPEFHDFNTYMIYRRDGKWYNIIDGTTEVENTDMATFAPKSMPGESYTYDGKNYQVYEATWYSNRSEFNISLDKAYGNTVSFRIELEDGFGSQVLDGTLEDTAPTVVKVWSRGDWVLRTASVGSLSLTMYGETHDFNGKVTSYTIRSEGTTTTVSAPYVVSPNFFLDSGRAYPFFTITPGGNTSSSMPTTVSQNTMTVESADLNTISYANDRFTLTWDVVESHLNNQYTRVFRSNSVAIGQNFWADTVNMSTTNVRTPYQLYVSNTAEVAASSSEKYTSWTNSSACDMTYYAGFIPLNSYKFFISQNNTDSEDVAPIHVGGYRVHLKGGWNLMYNINQSGTCDLSGISWSSSEDAMGTLVIPVDSVKDFYLKSNGNRIVYLARDNTWKQVKLDEVSLRAVMDNRFIIVNTTEYWNAWDGEENRKVHYATDYNNRAMIGQSRSEYRSTFGTVYTQGARQDARPYVTAVNSNYNLPDANPVISMLPYAVSYRHILSENDPIPYLRFFGSEVTESRDNEPIELFYTKPGNSASQLDYVASAWVYPNGVDWKVESHKALTQYSNGTSVLYPTDLLATFINGAGNNDFVNNGNSKFPLVYSSYNEPQFLYNYLSILGMGSVKHFFVLQGQYYAVIGSKIYAMVYTNGVITQQDAIVDIRDLYFVGNTPTIAFLVNPHTKQFYSFTGDAAVNILLDAGKYDFYLDGVGFDKEVRYWYDEGTQSIYIPTKQGLVCFGSQNTYCLEEYSNVEVMQFVDGRVYLTDSDRTVMLTYYREDEREETHTMKLETSFWGLGANEITSIDRWQITLYDPYRRAQDVKLTVRSITDVSTASETKVLHIDAPSWDKWSSSCLISYTPKLIKGQGIRLTVETDSSIQKIVPHVMDNKASTTTNRRFEV